MKIMIKKIGWILLSVLTVFSHSQLTKAQEITVDGNTATIVTKDGNRITIDGNTLSKDGKNLFHSFQEFGLSAEQIATFLTNPNIQNILSRVTGGNPSYLNGLIEVVGGNSNLYFMNPAGIVFGNGASLNVPADFTATTATGIQFNQAIFSGVGNNNYQELIGNPTGFIFNEQKVGNIINTGNLQLTEGKNLTLIGGNVINTGTIETPHGKINIQAVNGGSTVKITPEGSLLSLEVDLPKDEQGNLLGFTPQDLPTLLTGANNAGVATKEVAVNPNTGNIEVGVQGLHPITIPNESGLNVVSGKLDASSTKAGELGGEITLLGNKVAVIDGKIEANGANGGGNIKIGGDREGQGTIPNAEFTYISPESTINANALNKGDGGEIIVFAQDHASIHGELTAKGGQVSGDGGFIETSGLNSFTITTAPDTDATNGNVGEWLIDPHNIEINNDDFAEGFDPNNPFNAINDDATIGVSLIESALSTGNVTISTGNTGEQEGNITWNTLGNNPENVTLDYNNTGSNRTLTLRAANSIIFNGTIFDSDTTTVDRLNVVFNADRDGNSTGAIGIYGNMITNGGNVILGGGNNPNNNPAVGDIANSLNSGILITGTIDSGSGNIRATGLGTINNSEGIKITDGGIVKTTSGNITLTGTGSNQIDTSDIGEKEGVEISQQGEISTIDGSVLIIGTGGQGVNSEGINISLGNVEVEGQGNINLRGTGGSASNSEGIRITEGSRISSNQGNITLTGAGGNFTLQQEEGGNEGITVNENSQISSVDGLISLTGTGRDGSSSEGIRINNSNIFTTGQGNINLVGRGGSGINSEGIKLLDSATISTTQGNITLDGRGGRNNNLESEGRQGLSFVNNIEISTIDGDINLTGRGGFGNLSQGVRMIEGGNISSVSGNIVISGTGGNGNQSTDGGNEGVSINDLAQITNNDGQVLITGIGGNTSNSEGISIRESNILTTAQGNISLQGTGGGGSESQGIRLRNGTISTSGAGSITLDGNGGNSASGTLNHGVAIEGDIIAGDGGLNINGTSGRSNDSQAIIILQGDSLAGTNTGSITATGETVLTVDRGDIIFEDNTFNDLNTVNISAQNNVILRDINNLDLGESNLSGNLQAIVNGNITNSGSLTVSGTTNLETLSSNSNIILDQDNDFIGSVSIIGNDVNVNDVNNLVLENLSVSGDLTIKVGNNLTQTTESSITVFGDTFLTSTKTNGSNVNLTNTSSNDTVLDEVLIGGNFNLTADGNVTQTPPNQAVQVAGETTINAPNIALNNPDNIINQQPITPDVSVDEEGNVTITQLGTINLTDILNQAEISNNITGNLTVSSQAGDSFLTFDGDAINGNSINLRGNFEGTINISTLAPPIVQVDIIPAINQSESITVQGQTSLNATPQGDINLTVNSNDFVNSVTSIGKNINLTDSNNLILGNTEARGDLRVNANGDITQTELSRVSVLGATSFNAQLNNDIILTNNNSLLGEIDIVGAEVNISDRNYIILNNALVTENLTLTANGTITQLPSAIINVQGDTRLTTNIPNLADVNLTNNNSTGTVLDEVLIGGNFNLDSTGNVTQTVNGQVQVAGKTNINAPSFTLDNQNNIINDNLILETDSEGNINISKAGIVNISEILNNADLSNNILGNLTVTSTGESNNLTFDDRPINGQAINLTGNFRGEISINTNAPDVISTPTENPSIIQSESLIVNGNTILSATTDGNITLTQANDFIGVVSVSPLSANNVTLTDINDINLSSLSIQGDLTINSPNVTNLQGDISANSLTTDSEGSTNISANNIITTENQTYRDAVTLSQNTNLTGENLTFANTITGEEFDLTLNSTNNGNINLDGNVNNVNNLTFNSNNSSILGVGVINLNLDSISTNGNQTYNQPLILTKDTQLTGNNLTFNSSIDSLENASNLTVTANQNINYGDGIGNDSIGGNVGLQNLTSTAEDIFINLSPLEGGIPGGITTIGDQNYITVSDGQTIFLLNDTVMNTNNLNIDSSILIEPSLLNPVSLTINAEGNVSITGETNGDNIPVAISTALPDTSGNITINAGGDININGIVQTNDITNPTTSAGNVTINGNTNNAFNPSSYVLVGGINTSGLTSSGTVNINGNNLILGSIFSTSTETNIQGEIQLNGLNTLVIGEIQGNSLTVNNNLLLTNISVHPELISLLYPQLNTSNIPNFLNNSNITTTNNQTYNGNVFLETPVTFTGVLGSNINFNGGIDSFQAQINPESVNLPSIISAFATGIQNRNNATPQAIIFNNTNNNTNSVNFGDGINDDRIGSVAGLSSLTVNNGITNININTPENGNSINTTGNQTYNNPVIIADDTILNANNITFGTNITLGQIVSGNGSLTINSNNNGNTIVNGSIFGLSELITNADGVTIFNSPNANTVEITGRQIYNDNLQLNNQTTNFTTNSEFIANGTVNSNGNITMNAPRGINFNNNLTANGNLTLNSSDLTRFNGNVTAANSLNTDSTGITEIKGNVTTTNNQIYNDDILISNNITLTSNNDSISTQNIETTGNNLTISAKNNINTQNITTQGGNLQLIAENAINSNSVDTSSEGSINGNLTASGNQINFSDRLNINGTATLNTPNDLMLNNQNNNFNIIKINGANNINITDIDNVTLESLTTQGNLTVNSPNITIFNGNINANSVTTDSTGITEIRGNVTTVNNQNYNDDIVLGEENNITLTSNNASINTQNISGETNNLTISAQNNINTENITTQGGNINLISGQNINTNNLISNGGNIELTTQGEIQTANINTSSNQTKGGNITIGNEESLPQSITTGQINTSSNQQNAGNLTILSEGNIVFESIDARSSLAQGGNVTVNSSADFDATIRGTGFIPNLEGVTISTLGAINGDSITIKYDGDLNIPDSDRIPFIVGNTDVNGTAGAIQSSTTIITEDSFTFTETQNNISIISVEGDNNNNGNGGDNNNGGDNEDRNARLRQAVIDPDPFDNLGTPVSPLTDLVAARRFQQIQNLTILTIDQAKEILQIIEQIGTDKPALIYVSFTPKGYQPKSIEEDFARREAINTQEYQKIGVIDPNIDPTLTPPVAEEDQLDILIITSKDEPVRIVVPITRKEVTADVNELWTKVSDPFNALDNDDSYKTSAGKLYQALISPLQDILEEREITNLLFILPNDMRFLPTAALYDENNQQFLVEKYSTGLAPSLNLNNNAYRNIKDMRLLAMGASEFADNSITPLPAAGLELPTIRQVWENASVNDKSQYLNDNFTIDNLKNNLASESYGIIHLGTHGEFNPGQIEDSYIQFYDSRLGLNQVRNLGLSNPLVELLVLSACETAFGNESAELGFAGLAVQAGVKTAMGSVWQVSDTGTLALMTDFYGQLKTQSIKAEALRQAQLNMLTGKVYKTEDGNKIITPNREISLEELPPESRQPEDLSHPFYWAPFTMIGNPW